jgi:hypothetical protein
MHVRLDGKLVDRRRVLQTTPTVTGTILATGQAAPVVLAGVSRRAGVRQIESLLCFARVEQHDFVDIKLHAHFLAVRNRTLRSTDGHAVRSVEDFAD